MLFVKQERKKVHVLNAINSYVVYVSKIGILAETTDSVVLH